MGFFTKRWDVDWLTIVFNGVNPEVAVSYVTKVEPQLYGQSNECKAESERLSQSHQWYA